MALAALVKMHGHVEAVQVKVAKRSSNWVRTLVPVIALENPVLFPQAGFGVKSQLIYYNEMYTSYEHCRVLS